MPPAASLFVRQEPSPAECRHSNLLPHVIHSAVISPVSVNHESCNINDLEYYCFWKSGQLSVQRYPLRKTTMESETIECALAGHGRGDWELARGAVPKREPARAVLA